MAKREILFNDEVYSIEESVIEASLAEMKSRLVDDYSGSGTTIVYDGTTINVDSAKLAAAASNLAATLNNFAGSGASIVVNGVTYGIDNAKLNSAKENMSGSLGEMAGAVEEETESIVGTWVFNHNLYDVGSTSLKWKGLVQVPFSSGTYSNLEGMKIGNGTLSYCISVSQSKFINNGASVYSSLNGGTWNTSVYKTINILSDDVITDTSEWSVDDFKAWLKANATKQGATSLIAFTIDGTSYEAEDGMTWGEWQASEYNPSPNGITVSGNYIAIGGSNVGTTIFDRVLKTDVITPSATYYLVGNEPA